MSYLSSSVEGEGEGERTTADIRKRKQGSLFSSSNGNSS